MSGQQASIKRIYISIKSISPLNLAAIAVGAVLLWVYLSNLTRWKIDADEGEYLYQVWRMTLGEVPYRDFLTPQLPVFLYSGMTLMKIAGPSLAAMRIFSILLSFGTAILLFLAGREHKNRSTGLLAAAIYLLHVDVFAATRIFRSEALFVFFVTLGLVIAFWPTEQYWRHRLVLASLLFGLSTMVKLFGLLPEIGVGLWLAFSSWQNKRSFRDFVVDTLALIIPLISILTLLTIIFSAMEPQFLNQVVGHHLSQGSEQILTDVLKDKLSLYFDYLVLNPLFAALVILSAVIGVFQQDSRQPWSFQLLTAGAFLLLSRSLGQRHFLYLVPSMSILAGWVLADGISGRYRLMGRAAALLALMALLIPWLIDDLQLARWHESITTEVAGVIKEHVKPEEFVLTDDVGLAFYSQRPTTYSGAALSSGASSSGQITGDILQEEIIQNDVRLVIVDESSKQNSHLSSLWDYPQFRRFLERNFDQFTLMQRHGELLSIFLRKDAALWQTQDTLQVEHKAGISFGQSFILNGYTYEKETINSGETLYLTLFWESAEAVDFSWKIFVHLVGPEGDLIAQHDKYPYGGLFQTDRWRPGLIVDDQYSIYIPQDVAAGEYRIAIGMYVEATGERLQLLTPEGQPISDSRLLLKDTITVRVLN